MKCDEARQIIHAYADHELDLVKTLDIERHMQDCTKCAAAHAGIAALRSSIRNGSLYYRAPAGLEQQLRSSVRNIASPRRIVPRHWLAAAAIIVIAASCLLVIQKLGNNQQQLIVAEVASAHVRSLMAEHLWDVKSSDQHTVKPWFEGKLDFAPDVRDFKNESFPLEGGRLDYLANRPVAALVYKHDKHFINLFIWPAGGQSEQGESFTTHQGYSLVHWVHGGMNYWAVSDTSEETLRRFASVVGGGHGTTKPAL